MNKFTLFFEKFARKASAYTGKPATFVTAVMVVVLWAITGPIFDFSDTWQLVINTGTTIITFLMVFLVQSAQNRDAKALQLKLDELIYKMGKADNVMIDIEHLTEHELDQINEKYRKYRNQRLRKSKPKKRKDDALNNIVNNVTDETKRKNGKAKTS